MYVDVSISQGQQEARTRWGTQESGTAFDRKKQPFLNAEAREFLAQQVMCTLVGPGLEREPQALLLAGRPGFVEIPDHYTCLLPLDRRDENSPLLQGLHAATSNGLVAHVALCFVQHATRKRLCVQGKAYIMSTCSPDGLWLRVDVKQAFFHCPKYVRSKVSGLNIAAESCFTLTDEPVRDRLSAQARAFLARQVLCYLCTKDREGQYAVNHRGGAAGFLVTLEPDRLTPGGVVILPDYAGNGAFEAIGNILETGLATLLVPGYAEQSALCLAGRAAVLEPGQLPAFLREQCRGAQRIVAIMVRHVAWQTGDWSEALAHEQARTALLTEEQQVAQSCQV